MLDLKIDKLYESRKEDEDQKFHVLQVLRMKEDFWDKPVSRPVIQGWQNFLGRKIWHVICKVHYPAKFTHFKKTF